MLIARVVGSAVSTIKDEKLVNRKLLIPGRDLKLGQIGYRLRRIIQRTTKLPDDLAERLGRAPTLAPYLFEQELAALHLAGGGSELQQYLRGLRADLRRVARPGDLARERLDEDIAKVKTLQ